MDNCLLYHGDGEIDTFNSRKLTEDKVTELICIAHDFYKYFDTMMENNTIKAPSKRKYHRDGTLSKAEVMLIHQTLILNVSSSTPR